MAYKGEETFFQNTTKLDCGCKVIRTYDKILGLHLDSLKPCSKCRRQSYIERVNRWL